jgi:RNase H-fold protein (predicted Holliday junction resolvase)
MRSYEYKADQKQYKEQVQKLANGLQFRTIECTLTEHVHPERFSTTTADRNTSEILHLSTVGLSILNRSI